MPFTTPMTCREPWPTHSTTAQASSTIAYVPTNTNYNGAQRNIQVHLAHEKADLFYRHSYYADAAMFSEGHLKKIPAPSFSIRCSPACPMPARFSSACTWRQPIGLQRREKSRARKPARAPLRISLRSRSNVQRFGTPRKFPKRAGGFCATNRKRKGYGTLRKEGKTGEDFIENSRETSGNPLRR